MKTTREIAKENIHDNVVDSLQDILKRNYDAQAGYKRAMEHADSDYLKQFLKDRAVQRSHFATEIDQELRRLNEEPVDSGSTKAALHRSWMDVKNFVSSSTDEALLEECIRGEKASVKTYENVLDNQNFSPETTSMLNKQLMRVKNSLNEVKRLEDIEETVNS
ncbi:MAG: PA2169 family four-helix-bundle protein [Flavobacterium sp.]|nr:MAG: PA2169 family four-helix-bundle protein [Flavobacterium sp.]